MDEHLKFKLSEYNAGMYSSRLNNTNNSNTLRNKSQNNVSRMHGVYSKIVSKGNVTRDNDLTARNLSWHNNLSNYATNGFKKPGDLSRIQTRQDNGKLGNDSLHTSMRDTTRNDTSNYTSHRSEEVSRNRGRREPVNASLRKKSPILNGHDSSVRVPCPPQRVADFHPEPIENNVSKRIDLSTRVLSPPQRVAAFHPEPIENNVSKRMDLSTRLGVTNINLSPRVLLKDFRREVPRAIERDNDGFLMPGLPVQRFKTKADKIEDLMKNSIIVLNDFLDQIPQEVECSDWAAPCVVLRKPNGKLRICADFSTGLNQALQVQQFPLPTQDEIFSNLSGGQKFSTLDLTDAYLSIPVDEESKKLLMECYYFLSRSERCLMEVFRKSASTRIIGSNGFPQDKGIEIASWVQNSVVNDIDMNLGSMTASVIHEYPPSTVSGSVARTMNNGWNAPPEPVAKTICTLRDWTIIKGSGPFDVLVSGDILDINSQVVIEENHVSSKIISADVVYVQTSSYVYHLSRTFQDRSCCIPQSVKRYFNDGRFPREWKEVVKMWGVLNENQANRLPEQNGTYSRVPYEERIHIDRIRRQAEVERDIDRLAMERGEEVSHTRMVAGSPPNERQVKELVDRYLREKAVTAIQQERSMWKEEAYRRAATSHGRRRDEEDEVPVRDTDVSDLEPDQNTRSHILDNTSRYGRKRKANVRYENERRNKIRRVEIQQQKMRTPKSTGRLSAIGLRTRSALRGRRLDSFLCTPKSSKAADKNLSRRHKLMSRPKTPMPAKAAGRGRRVIQDDSVFSNDSDLA